MPLVDVFIVVPFISSRLYVSQLISAYHDVDVINKKTGREKVGTVIT